MPGVEVGGGGLHHLIGSGGVWLFVLAVETVGSRPSRCGALQVERRRR